MRFTPLATGSELYHVTVREWIDGLLVDLLLTDLDRPAWQLPDYAVAHGEEWVATFLRDPRDF